MQLKKNKTKRTSSNGSEASLTGIPVLLLTACTIFKMLSLTVLGLIPLIYNKEDGLYYLLYPFMV